LDILEEFKREIARDTSLGGEFNDLSPLDKRVNSLKQQILDAGLDESLTEPRETLFSKIIDVLDTPLQAVSGVVDAAFFEHDLNDVGLFGAARRGMDENIDPFELTRKADIENPIARGLIGFGASMALDPLNLITGGSKGAVFGGGKALSKVGQAAKGDLIQRLTQSSGDELMELGQAGARRAIEADNLADDAFLAADKYRQGLKEFRLAKKAGNTDLQKLIARDMLDLKPKVAPLLESNDLGLNNLDELFQDAGVKLELGIPFLGHLTGAKRGREISKDAGILSKSLTAVGDILNPATLSTKTITAKDVNNALDNLGVGESFRNVYEGARQYGNASLGVLSEALNKMEKVPVLGAPVSVGKGVASGAKKAMDIASNGFQSVFMRKALYGPEFDKDRQLYINYYQAAANQATETTERLLPELLDESKRPLLREALVDIDTMIFDPIEELMKNGGLDGAKNKLLDNLNKMARGVDFEDVELAKIPGLEDAFRRSLDLYLKNPEVSDELKDVVQRTIKHFDELAYEERMAGVNVGFLESYIPHLYENAKEAILKDGIGSGGGGINPFRARTYKTFEEAITNRPLVPKLNLAEIVQHRTKQSLQKRAEKQFFNRVVMQGMSLEKYQELARLAKDNPEVAAYIQRKKLPLPKFLSEEQIKVRQEVLERQGATKSMLRNEAAKRVQQGLKGAMPSGNILDMPGDPIRAAYGAMEEFGDDVAELIKDPAKAKQFAKAQQARMNSEALTTVRDFSEQLSLDMYSNGKRPLDAFEAEPLLGEVATMVVDKGKRVVLPTPIAKSFNETVAHRDKLREMFADSDEWQNFVDLADSSLNFMKRTVTAFFPAYWTRNLIGDGFFRAMDGGLNAIEPGLYPEVHGALTGKNGLKLADGRVMDSKTFQEVLKQNGLSFKNNEYIDAIKAAADTDIDKYVQKRKGFLKNIKDPMVALDIAEQGMRDRFENFFRISHLAHRLKNGDTIRDAVLRTNDALINYRDLNEFERSFARRMWMFYGWTSKATKKAVTSLFTAPGDIKMQTHTARAISEMLSGEEALTQEEFNKRELRSLVSMEQVAFPLGKDKDGKIVTGRGFGLPFNALGENLTVFLPRNLTLSELSNTFGDSVSRTLQKQAAQSNPGLRMIAEQISGKNLFFDKPLDSKFLRKLPQFEETAKNIAGYPYTKIPAKLLDETTRAFLGATPDGEGNMIADPGKFYVLTSVFPALGRAISTSRTLTRDELSGSQRALGALTGIRVEGQELERSLSYEQQRNLEDVILRNNVSELLNNPE
jgi:hypothetical protein